MVGNAISRGNEELEAALDRRLNYTSAANTIKEEFLKGRHVLAVAGTHGKTTTTAILAWLLESAGMKSFVPDRWRIRKFRHVVFG